MSTVVEKLSEVTYNRSSVRTRTILDEAFIRGNVFSYEDYRVMGADEVVDILFDPTDFSGQNLIITAPQFASSGGPITVDFYIGTDADSDGTLLDPSNRKGTSDIEPQSIIRLNPTINSVGTRFTGRVIPATSTAPATASNASAGSNIPFEIDTSYKYLIRFTNTDGAGVYLQTDFTWLEIREEW